MFFRVKHVGCRQCQNSVQASQEIVLQKGLILLFLVRELAFEDLDEHLLVELDIVGEDGEDSMIVEGAKHCLKVDVIELGLTIELAFDSTELLQVNLGILLKHS